jgi:hypothetical protein
MREFGTTLDCVVLITLSWLLYYLYGLAWPLAPGRDYGTYLLYYLQIPDAQPTYPMLMLYRTPLVPLFIGSTLQLGGPALLECAYAVGYGIAVLSTYYIGSQLSRRTAWISALAMLAYPPMAILLHSAGSDSTLGCAWMAWCAFVFWTAKRPSIGKFILNGIMAVALVLIRPGNMMPLFAFAGFPFVLDSLPFRKRVISSGAYLATFLSCLGLWQTYNLVRYGDFTVARGQGAIMLYRVFVIDALVSPSNGPASRALAEVVERDLLTKEPYKSYGIDLAVFFNSHSTRFYGDLIGLSDRTWGWDSRYRHLRLVALEAIKSHFPRYVAYVAADYLRLFASHYVPEYHHRAAPAGDRASPRPLNERGLPIPTEGQPIPYSYVWWLATTPDGGPVSEQRANALSEERAAMPTLPTRDGSPFVAKAINTLVTHGYPSMFVCILIGLVGLGILAPKGTLWKPWTRTALYLMAISALILAISTASVEVVKEYRLPFDPLFIVFAVAGLVRDVE